MDGSRSLFINFNLPDKNIFSGELRSVVGCVDSIGRAVINSEIGKFIRAYDIPEHLKRQVYFEYEGRSRHLILPFEILNLERGSIKIKAGISAAAILWILHKMVLPPVIEAWDESMLKQEYKVFLRDHLFLGAAKSVKSQVGRRRQYGNVRISKVEENISVTKDSQIDIHLERTHINEINSTEAIIEEIEELDEILKRKKE